MDQTPLCRMKVDNSKHGLGITIEANDDAKLITQKSQLVSHPPCPFVAKSVLPY